MTDTSTVLSDNEAQNYQQFFEDAINTGCVWGLEGDQGWALCSSEKSSEIDVMPFWSQSEFAESHLKDDWQSYQLVAIALDEFMDDWLTGMHEDVILVGVNWNQNLEGREVEPLDLLHTFEVDYLS